MESQNKVMTVSYGTFSCTLDGFDDPFTTMQLVAEYFRKLAAQDRYFGGEPLQPDHNALHQIAQDANPYKVDAEVTETGVTLRKADVVDAAPAPAPENDNAPAPAPIAKTTEPEQAPVFTSKRSAPAPAPAQPTDADEEASFVEAAVFSSRRGALAASEDEPQKPASELIAEQDAESTSEGESEPADFEVAPVEAASNDQGKEADIEAIKAQITQDVEEQDQPAASALETPKDNIQAEEEALERLLETTNSKLDNPAHARKSNALERLKAAVAATEAERRLRADPAKTKRPTVQDLSGDPVEFKSRMGEVRKKHEDVVNLSRPKAKKTGDRARGSFATLILGNDQRVNAAEAAASAKKPEADGQPKAEETSQRPKPDLKIVQPEQRAPRATTSPAQGFAQFAQDTGAASLRDLLEASAAYLTIVDNEPRFGKDRILSNLDTLPDPDFTPEAANRMLQNLMREGRILRVKKDSYTISKATKLGFQSRLAG